MREQTIALLVAAGKSERMQMDVAKPYLHLGGESLMRRTVKLFMEHPAIDGVRVVIRREHHAAYKSAIAGLTLFPCVMGGATRQESVRLGLESIAHRKPRYVLVHDAARPHASPELISRIHHALQSCKASIPALPITDTVKRVQSGHMLETVPREMLYTVQTPQGFHFDTLLDAHRRFKDESLPDDAALIEKAGGEVVLTEGEISNIKITTAMDIERMKHFLALSMETRVGTGYDVHALQPHDHETPVSQQHIRICGISIPFTHYLMGHSDADVGLHALVDAILGAIGDGDIGMHFSPDDQKWKGADSSRFLLYAYERLRNRGGELVNVDVTIVGERPKISPYRDQMVEHISQLLKISSDRVSIKATTSEKLGFIGRSEGIAAQAIATVRLPHS